MALTDSELAQYLDQGYLSVPDVIAPDAFDLLIAELEANIDAQARVLAAEGKLDELCEGMSFAERLAHLCAAVDDDEARQALWRIGHGKHHKTAGMFAVWTHPTLVDVAEQIIGSEILAHPQYNIRAKLPNQLETVVPWHQDLGYLERDADETFMLNFWIPLVDAPMEPGALAACTTFPAAIAGIFCHTKRSMVTTGCARKTCPPTRSSIVRCPWGAHS